MIIPYIDKGFIDTYHQMDFRKLFEMDMEDCWYI